MFRVGVDLGGTKIQSVLLNKENRVLANDRRLTPHDNGPPGVAHAIAASVAEVIRKSKVPMADVMGIGVGSPGQIDKRAGTVSHAGNLPGWDQSFPLGVELAAQINKPVDLGNDVQLAVRAESELGAGVNLNSFIGVFLGTGIGGGVIINRKEWLGRGAAGEIGHMIISQDGPSCPCGRFGCLEAYAGRAAMEAQARAWQEQGQQTILFDIMKRKKRARLTSGVWAKALKKHDPMATRLIDRAVSALSVGIASAVNLLDPDGVIVGGGLGIRLGQPFLDRVVREATPLMIAREHPPEFAVASLGDLGGAIGAGLLPLD